MSLHVTVVETVVSVSNVFSSLNQSVVFSPLLLPSSHFSPQFKRKSTEGVSYFLFALVILGNTTYGLSVLLKNPDEGQGETSYMVHHLPWLIGSLGTLSLDLIVSFEEKITNMAAAACRHRASGLSLIPRTCYILGSAELKEDTSSDGF